MITHIRHTKTIKSEQVADKITFPLRLTLIFLFCTLFGLQLFLSNFLATKGSQVSVLDKETAALQFQTRELEGEVASLGSLGLVVEKSTAMGLTAAPKAEFLNPAPLALSH